MTRVAVVVQRCHESVVGGSEALAWQYAQLLSSRFEVEVLTTTATDHMSWENVLPAGLGLRNGLPVQRFPVVIGRSPYWNALYQRLQSETRDGGGPGSWRAALQEEFIRFQGPWSPPLHQWLRTHADWYDAFVFCTYLYPTTYFGIQCVPAARAILVPTLHDEMPAHLPVFRACYARRPNRIWLTAAEKRTASRVWGFDGGDVLGMAVDAIEPARPEERGTAYFLYCGRIDAGKGCDVMLRAFASLRSHEHVRLVLTGVDNMGLQAQPGVEYLGFVGEERKRSLMAGALAYVMPSANESFSITTLEAMAQKTPVLANAQSDVLRDHVEQSGGGLCWSSAAELTACMEQLLEPSQVDRTSMGEAGRSYVLARYGEDVVRDGLCERIACTALAPRVTTGHQP